MRAGVVSALIGLIKTHPVLSYFAATFAISWGGFVLVVGPYGIPAAPEDFERMPLLAIMVMLAGPAAAGPVVAFPSCPRWGHFGHFWQCRVKSANAGGRT